MLATLFSAASAGAANNEVFFRAKPNYGNWGAQKNISGTATDTRYAMVASSPNHIIVVFTDNSAGTGQYDWYYAESTDNGWTWTLPALAIDPAFDIGGNELDSAAIEMDASGVVHMSFMRQKQFNTNS